tara:strand:- start:297 stop:584 length:288 start_codon:yes stop_codon:yes gene_type:complete
MLDIDKHSKKYIKFIKTKKCTSCYAEPVDADHLKTVGMGNDRKKPRIEDFTCIPLCRNCHIERHQIGNYQFEHKNGVNLWKDAFNYLMEYLTDEQ